MTSAAEKNKKPILTVVRQYIKPNNTVLEIGSGDGVHALFFANALPLITWQTSELHNKQTQLSIVAQRSIHNNVLEPLSIDVGERSTWPKKQYAVIFSANTLHIISMSEVKSMLLLASQCLLTQGYFIVYGPFNIAGKYTSESNRRFDEALKEHAPHMGLRCLDDITHIANTLGLSLVSMHDMPANNKTLVFQLN